MKLPGTREPPPGYDENRMAGARGDYPVEIVCDHLSAGGPSVTHLRGTILASSLAVLKAAGHHERYLAQLDPSFREQVLFSIAHSWVPIEVGVAHYEACEAMRLDDAQLVQIGELVAARYAETFLATLLRVSRDAGIEGPWSALRSQGRLWDRTYLGGRVRVLRTGPKDGTIEFYGLPLGHLHYFRVAYCAYYRGIANMFVRNAHLKLARASLQEPAAFALAGSWV